MSGYHFRAARTFQRAMRALGYPMAISITTLRVLSAECQQ